MSSVAIITARGGSKRIPKKNIKDFLGFPIIKYSIDAAINSGCFSEIMVSTDDREIAETAIKYGAQVPFMRSAETANDYSVTADVISEVLNTYINIGKNFEYACCIYPTAPLIDYRKIQEGYEVIKRCGASTLIPVVKFSYPIQRGLKIEKDRLQMIWPENINVRSQDLMPAYHDVGQFYWMCVELFLKDKKLFTDNTALIEIPESEVQDIDNEEDWKIAEVKYRILKGKGIY